jgi:uncharacterized protein (DUF488 family)
MAMLTQQEGTPALHALYTLGYLAWTPAAFVQRVEVLGAVVADIRFSPSSRHPAWRQTALKRTLEVWYHHVPTLGNRNYKGGPVEIVDLDAGLEVVHELLEASPVLLLCACRDVQRCHRRLVAEACTAWYGVPVTHLEPPATAETLPLFPEDLPHGQAHQS